MPDPTNPLNYINPFSRCLVHLTMDFGGERIATGTGFIRQRQGERFLITAWHNLSAREPATLRPKHRQGALPNYVTIEGFNITIRCPLYHDDDPNDEVHCQRCFWQHPLGPTLDVAVLRISSSSSAGLPIDEYRDGTRSRRKVSNFNVPPKSAEAKSFQLCKRLENARSRGKKFPTLMFSHTQPTKSFQL